jgi:hypothetical protein
MPYSAKSICKRCCGKYSTCLNIAPVWEAVPLTASTLLEKKRSIEFKNEPARTISVAKGVNGGEKEGLVL